METTATPTAVPTVAPGGEPPGDVDDWRAVLDFERGWPGTPSPKGRAVRARFGTSLTRYHQALDRALELPEALERDPMLVMRLRRLREERRSRRTARRLTPRAGGNEERS